MNTSDACFGEVLSNLSSSRVSVLLCARTLAFAFAHVVVPFRRLCVMFSSFAFVACDVSLQIAPEADVALRVRSVLQHRSTVLLRQKTTDAVSFPEAHHFLAFVATAHETSFSLLLTQP